MRFAVSIDQLAPALLTGRCSMSPLVENRCLRCNGPLIEIERFGERLIGCTECNRWTWPDSESISMALPEDDLYVIKATLGRG